MKLFEIADNKGKGGEGGWRADVPSESMRALSPTGYLHGYTHYLPLPLEPEGTFVHTLEGGRLAPATKRMQLSSSRPGIEEGGERVYLVYIHT